ncbi:enoyl-CoA hydratase/isomerase [gamma proteobacterium NOR5-3]|nr:enoyl-CoA hydratase/isomerase [gamma proteobacterium NOR5-3]
MSTSDPCSFEIDAGLAVVTLHHAPHNLLGPVLMQSLLDALEQVRTSGARAVMLKSGLRHFSAGADLSLFEAATGGGDGLAVSPVQFLSALEEFPLPIVASIHGVCVGGGLELALACDFIIAARSAKLGSVEVTLGINPLMGAVQRQVARCGALRAKELSMLGRRYDAETLERWNLINRVVDDEHLDEAAFALATELANGPTLAHQITKQLARLAEDQGVAAADREMEALQQALWSSEDLKIGLESLQKNGPGHAKFVGR